ncbi:hypothetical protein [Magnetospirillum sp. UT-4]|uniref:hypothetical protein n=1 Tax=Magnetospirillum sp. UT-4 TaxID=2681467 RepID=UPI0013823CBD|nr:hypothetical protein [Magnetospirillum sp. UT-4]CAA7612711.1 conserved exported hypothetical protein [Magnetospirillum sp. UT-4]
MSWSLARKVSAALVAILVCTMALTAYFGYAKFAEQMSAQVQSRFSFVVFTIKRKVEDGLSLGFALRQLRQTQDTIELEKARDDRVLGIEIYDASGEVLFNTDRGGVGSAVPEAWIEVLKGAPGKAFSLTDEEAGVVGMPLVNTLGKVEGAVVLRYPAAYLEQGLGEMLGRLAFELVLVVSGFAMVAAVAAYVLLGAVTRRLGAMEATLAKVMAEGGEAVPDPGGGDDFEVRFAEFVARSREAVEHIRDSTDEVERMDRLA